MIITAEGPKSNPAGQSRGQAFRHAQDTFSRNAIPAGFYDAGTERGRQMLRELGLESPQLPVVVVRFGPQRSTLLDPSNLKIAEAFGLMTPVGVGEVFDVAVVGAGPLVHRYLQGIGSAKAVAGS